METQTDNNDYTRRNRFTGESIELTKEEAEKHDKIFYHEALATLEDKELGTGASKHWQEMRNLLDWFMKNNAKAYMSEKSGDQIESNAGIGVCGSGGVGW